VTALKLQHEIELGEKYAEAARKQLALDRQKLAELELEKQRDPSIDSMQNFTQ
jgi:hypothetical protein